MERLSIFVGTAGWHHTSWQARVKVGSCWMPVLTAVIGGIPPREAEFVCLADCRNSFQYVFVLICVENDFTASEFAMQYTLPANCTATRWVQLRSTFFELFHPLLLQTLAISGLLLGTSPLCPCYCSKKEQQHDSLLSVPKRYPFVGSSLSLQDYLFGLKVSCKDSHTPTSTGHTSN